MPLLHFRMYSANTAAIGIEGAFLPDVSTQSIGENKGQT